MEKVKFIGFGMDTGETDLVHYEHDAEVIEFQVYEKKDRLEEKLNDFFETKDRYGRRY